MVDLQMGGNRIPLCGYYLGKRTAFVIRACEKKRGGAEMEENHFIYGFEAIM